MLSEPTPTDRKAVLAFAFDERSSQVTPTGEDRSGATSETPVALMVSPPGSAGPLAAAGGALSSGAAAAIAVPELPTPARAATPTTQSTSASANTTPNSEAAQVSAALNEAQYIYQPLEEDALLSALITDIRPQRTPFKLLPAYGVYLMCRYCQASTGSDGGARVADLLSKSAVLVRMNVMNATDVAALAFWLANASELSMALRSDYTLAAFGCAESQQQLAETAQEAYTLLLAEIKRRLKPGVAALLVDEISTVVPGSPTSRSSNTNRLLSPSKSNQAVAEATVTVTATATATSATCASTGPSIASTDTGCKSTTPDTNSSSGSNSSVLSIAAAAEIVPPTNTVQYLLTTLEAALQVTRNCLVSSGMIEQLIQAAFYFIGAEAFNAFISDKTLWRCDAGLFIRYNLSRLTDWASRHGFRVDSQLRLLTQASQLLQMQKTSLQYLDRICESCADLNSLQMEKILRNYKPGVDEGPVPATLIDCVQGRFMATMDKNVLDDETVGGKLQLLRNPDFALPFRLTGESHMSRRLVRLRMRRRRECCFC